MNLMIGRTRVIGLFDYDQVMDDVSRNKQPLAVNCVKRRLIVLQTTKWSITRDSFHALSAFFLLVSLITMCFVATRPGFDTDYDERHTPPPYRRLRNRRPDDRRPDDRRPIDRRPDEERHWDDRWVDRPVDPDTGRDTRTSYREDDPDDDRRLKDQQRAKKGRGKKPKKIKKSFAFYRRKPPAMNDPNGDDYHISYGKGDFQAFREEYDTDKDGRRIPEVERHRRPKYERDSDESRLRYAPRVDPKPRSDVDLMPRVDTPNNDAPNIYTEIEHWSF